MVNILQMKDFFYAIQDLFVDYLFWPFDFLRDLDITNWWLSNIVSWTFTFLCLAAFVYWMKQLKGYNDNNEEDKSVTAHDYL